MQRADDERLGQLLRSIRREAHFTQAELADSAGVPVGDVMTIEAGHLGEVKLERARNAFAVFDARVRVSAWWRGAWADQLLDAAHAAIVETTASIFARRGWRCIPEFSFAEFGERGSIDLFAAHERAKVVAACEIKSAFESLEDTNRTLDAKVRLAPKLAMEAFGFRPEAVGRLLIVPDTSGTRAVVRRHETTMGLIYPERSRAIRRWIRAPRGPLAGIWFLSNLGNRERVTA
jgi:transcriptional regulator with XRE-family HTH domain